MSSADVIDREVAWLSTEPLAGYPSLLKAPNAPDGVFDYIGGHTRRLSQNPAQMHVYRNRFIERRESTSSKVQISDMVLGILWPKILNAEQADKDQSLLEAALGRLLTRLRSINNDHTHGGRFWQAGESGQIQGATDLEVEWPEWRTGLDLADAPLAAGKAYVVEVRYPIIEFVTG